MPEVEIKVGALEPKSDAADLDLSVSVAGAAPLYFDDPEEAQGYPLAQRILALDCVSAVLLQDSKLTICRSNSAGDWDAVLSAVRPVIVDHFAQTPEGRPPREPNEAEKELMLRVQNVLNTEINPMIASHGGFIEVLDVIDKTAYVNMTGGCQGCAQSAMTLRQGVERIVLENVPEITQILDSTDHASGANPYYA